MFKLEFLIERSMAKAQNCILGEGTLHRKAYTGRGDTAHTFLKGNNQDGDTTQHCKTGHIPENIYTHCKHAQDTKLQLLSQVKHPYGRVAGWIGGRPGRIGCRKYNHFVAQIASSHMQELKLSLRSKLGPIVAIVF